MSGPYTVRRLNTAWRECDCGKANVCPADCQRFVASREAFNRLLEQSVRPVKGLQND